MEHPRESPPERRRATRNEEEPSGTGSSGKDKNGGKNPQNGEHRRRAIEKESEVLRETVI